MLSSTTPFVLLDDARAQNAVPARLYRDPVDIVEAGDGAAMPAMFARLRAATAQGLHVAGYLSYAAGYSLNSLPQPGHADRIPAGWFGLFRDYETIAPGDVDAILPQDPGTALSPLQPLRDRESYAGAFARVRNYIQAGDIYQANLTFRAAAEFSGHPLSLYRALRPKAAAGYGGVIWTGSDWHLSFSPELFFSLRGRNLGTKPMKGTAKRHGDPQRDAQTIHELQQDAKQRAENLMIVDLLRNDLSRVCAPGSVAVPELFRVESYPTVHQMVSLVTGQLEQGHDAVDVLAALFPCGSITGAPKRRAMQIIDGVEDSARGIYCGSVGRIDPDGDAAFNVAIRTFSLPSGAQSLSLGLGSGIVADSDCDAEWDECLAKGEFARMDIAFDLIETMGFRPESGIARLERHLARVKESARILGFPFDRHETRNRLHAVTFHLEEPSRIRLLLSRTGRVAITSSPLAATGDAILSVAIAPLPVLALDMRLRHKTSDRGFYDLARNEARHDEVVFVDPQGALTEGSYHALFVERDGKLVTPPLSRGLLPLVLRQELIESGQAVEGDLTPSDLRDGFWLGNSLRGLRKARLQP